MEQMHYNLLFRWFVGLGIDDAVWVPTVFSKNRDRLLKPMWRAKFLRAILRQRTRWRACCRTSISRSTARWSKPGRP